MGPFSGQNDLNILLLSIKMTNQVFYIRNFVPSIFMRALSFVLSFHTNDLVIANRLLLFYQLPLPKHSVKYKRERVTPKKKKKKKKKKGKRGFKKKKKKKKKKS